MGLLLDFCSVSLDCLSRHVSYCTGFIVGSLAVCFVYRSSFTGFLAVIAYLSFQMNFTINLVMSRKKTNLTLFLIDSNLEITFFMLKYIVLVGLSYGKILWKNLNENFGQPNISFICLSQILYLSEGFSHRFFIFLKFVPTLCM